MRTWLAALILAPFVLAQEPPPPEEPKAPEKPATDEWAIQKPASAPTGEPIALKVAVEPGRAHRVDMTAAQEMTTPMGPMSVNMRLGMLLKILRKNEQGEADFEMPIEIKAMSMNGQDMLAVVAGMLDNPRITGKLDANAKVVKDSLKVIGMGQMGGQMKNQVNTVLPKMPEQNVRVGEVWEISVAEFAAAMSAGVQGGTTDGKVYQRLEKIEEKNGVKLAHISTLFSIRTHGDNLVLQGGMGGKGEVRVRGTLTSIHGLDGYQRSVNGKIKLKMDVGGMQVSGDLTQSMTGGPERFQTKAPGDEKK